MAKATSRTAEGGFVVSKAGHEGARKMWGAAAQFNPKPVQRFGQKQRTAIRKAAPLDDSSPDNGERATQLSEACGGFA